MENDNARVISNIHWFPGHMTKAFRLIEREIKNVDAVIELLDARVPLASKNPELARATAKKPRIVALNKSDLADERATKAFLNYYREHGYGACAISSKDKKSARRAIDEALGVISSRRRSAGKPVIMVVGIPNVGKSTFINSLAGSARARVEDRPGVTLGKQMISLPEADLVDMPGVLWKKLEDQRAALFLAFTGAIRDGVLDSEEIACCLLERLSKASPTALCERYKLADEDLALGGYDMLEAVARGRGMLKSGGVADTERAAASVLDELRAGKLGRITFEEVPSR